MIPTLMLLTALSAPVCEGIPATFLRIIDGDTYRVRAHGAFDVHVDIFIRLEGVDTPEVRGLTKTAGLAAKEFVETWAMTYPDVVVYDTGRMSFNRHVSRVCPTGGGQCLSEALLNSGHAVPYKAK